MEHEKSNEGPLLVPIKDAAQRLSLSPWSVYKLADEGRLTAVYQGRRRYVTAESMREYVAGLSNTPESA